MKKLLSFLSVVAVVAFPVVAQAATFAAGDQYSRGSQDRVVGNLYVAGGTLSVASDVTGDLLMAGGSITVNGRVGNDVAAMGGNLQLLGPVGDDARVLGGQITIGDRIGGELVVMGGTVHLLSSSVVAGDVTVNGGQVIIEGTVQGSVRMMGGRLTINGAVNGNVDAKLKDALILGSDAHVGGTLTYSAPAEAQMASGAHVAGLVTYNPSAKLHLNQPIAMAAFWTILTMITAMKMIAYLGMVALIVWHWRRWALELMQEAHDKVWSALGHGLVYMIVLPVCTVLLLMSFVGILPGVLLGMVTAALGIFANVLAGMFVGAWISKVVGKRQLLHITWFNALGGTVILFLLTLIPVVGWVIQGLVMLAMFGVLAQSAQKQIF